MKTPLYIMALVVFSALMLSPKLPVEYPPQRVLDQRKEIVYKEQKINRLIQEIEHTLVIDSLQIRNNEQ